MAELRETTGRRVGVVIPSYNEEASIANLVKAVRSAVPSAEILVVDDSPGQETRLAVEAVGDPQTKVLKRAKKGGRGTAVIDGLRELYKQGCDQFVEMDADFSHPPAQIPELLKLAESQSLDLLIASRYITNSRIDNWPLTRRVFSRLSNTLAKFMLSVPVNDYTNGFRFYSRRAANLITSTCGQRGTGFIALSEILVSVYYSGMKVAEVPTIFVNRVRGESSLNHKEILNALTGLMKIYDLKKQLMRKKAGSELAENAVPLKEQK